MKKTALICLTFGWLGLAQGQLSCDELGERDCEGW
jgi:hypothetical protein